MDHHEVARRSLASYDEERGLFQLRILTDDVTVNPGQRSVSWNDPSSCGGKPPGFHYWLVSVVYLICARDKSPSGRWVKAESLQYGEFFFRGPHELPTGDIERAFDSEAGRFAAAAQSLGGTPWAQGKNAFVLPALPKAPLLVQFWERDEEFPARAGILFDSEVCDQLPIDALFSLVTIAGKRLVEKGRDI